MKAKHIIGHISLLATSHSNNISMGSSEWEMLGILAYTPCLTRDCGGHWDTNRKGPSSIPVTSPITDRSQCGFRKHRSTTDHLVSLERYLRDAFAQRQQAVGLFFDLEKAYGTTWQYGIIRDLHRIGLRGRLPVFVSEYLRDRQIWELGQHSLKNSTQRNVFQLTVSWLWHVLDWRLMSCPLVLPRTSSKHSLSMTWRSVFEDALWTP